MPRYLLDTDVASELARAAPSPRVLSFVADLDEVLLSSVGLFELARGIERLAPGKKRRTLERWLEQWIALPVTVVSLDARAARIAASMETNARRTGRAVDVRDVFVLATARAHGLTVATRNVTHFAGHGVPVHDPFAGA